MKCIQIAWRRSLLPSGLGVLLVLMLTALVAQAQGPGPGSGGAAKDVAATVAAAPELSIDAGIGSPPPAGFTTLYMFTGVANEDDSGRDEATSINCTNYNNTTAVEVRVEIYGPNPANVYVATQVINAGRTETWSTQSIEAFRDGIIFPSVPLLFQGSGRILVRQHNQIICNAVLVDADVDPPVFGVSLTIFDRYGRIAKDVKFIRLPMIMRQ